MTAVTAAIDLRSDTVTRPTPAMRRAIAEAEVGDDVYGEDPTVARLEARVAELIGTEAAVFVPSGTMANQIALALLVRPGEKVLVGQDAHCWKFESGALAALSGAQTHVLPGDGRFTAADVRAAYEPPVMWLSPSTVVAVENTHNMGGGLVWDRGELAAVVAAARELGMALHLDGARLWNAAAALGVPERELAAGFDTVAVCLSKGLGAPVGSLVCTTRARIDAARRLRKRFGGGMRQVGLLAAAGLYALDHHRARLPDDHANARALAEAVGVDPATVATNIVVVPVARPQAVVDACARRGVRIGTAPGGRVRVVTHLDVDRDACLRAAAVLRESIDA